MLKVERLKLEIDSEAGVVHALDDVSIAVARGETLALVGESGCGKSMSALALMRLLPDSGRVADGAVRLEGQDVLGLPEAAMRTVRGGRIGMIFQEPSTSLNPVMRVGDQLVEAIELHTPLRGDDAREKALEWLRRVGIPEPERRIDDYPFRMSGGQKQRVMIAMTLAAEPDFVVADEPTTALDATVQKQILDLLRDLQREQGMGLILITHDLGVVAGMADRVGLMYAGQIIEMADAQDFFDAPRHPYAHALLQSLPDSARRGEMLATIPGSVPPLTRTFDGCRFAERCDRATNECRTTPPQLTELEDGHHVRCFHPVDAVAPHTVTPTRAEPHPEPLRLVETSAHRADSDMPLLSVRNLHVHFPVRGGIFNRIRSHVAAVSDVSFDIVAGKTLALVGESGSGKTTTGRAILQLLRGQARTEGQALLRGDDLFTLTGPALQAARRDIQIIFQDPFASLNPRMRIEDILDEGIASLLPELDRAARHQRIVRLMDQVGLRRETLQRYPHEFSGGQRQRIAIARALAVQPKLIVCDEPTSALDVSVQAQILNLLREIQHEQGVSYLFITHNIAVVEYLADDIAVMRNGRIEEQGPCRRILDHPHTEYTLTLLSAVQRMPHGNSAMLRLAQG